MQTLTAYTFDELPDSAKEKALQECRHIPTDIFKWWDFIYEEWIEKLATMGYETDSDHIWFSGFWRQGDGASFQAGVDVLKWLEHTDPDGEEFRSLRYWLKKLGSGAGTISIVSGDNRYSHEYAMMVDWEWQEWIEPPKAVCQLRELAEPVLDHAREQARKLYRELEAECEGMMSDEYVGDFLTANEYLFWKDGRPVK